MVFQELLKNLLDNGYTEGENLNRIVANYFNIINCNSDELQKVKVYNVDTGRVEEQPDSAHTIRSTNVDEAYIDLQTSELYMYDSTTVVVVAVHIVAHLDKLPAYLKSLGINVLEGPRTA